LISGIFVCGSKASNQAYYFLQGKMPSRNFNIVSAADFGPLAGLALAHAIYSSTTWMRVGAGCVTQILLGAVFGLRVAK
jgi:hypothetical protein